MASTRKSKANSSKAELLRGKNQKWKQVKNDYVLYIMLLLPIIYLIVFKYVPMTNIIIAFKNYNIFKGVWDSPWVGLDIFKQVFATDGFYRALRNTIVLNFLDLIFGFPAPIILAILLNEICFKRFKKITQTIIYMPHFLSWIIISGIAMQVFAPNTGIVNLVLRGLGMPAVPFLNEPVHWVISYVLIGVWQGVGWNTIIYLAAITGVNIELYEAAVVDGANRWKKIWHVTLPGIRPTVVTLLILNLGRILSISFDRPYAMGNYFVTDVADVISTFVYRVGIQSQQYSLATAVGLFQSLVCIIFLVAANFIAERMGEDGIM
ncbi:MAG: ABC transporter permease subunit [Anaerocolumna sp.]